MAKVNAEVTNAVVDGKGHGEKIQIEEDVAKRLEAQGYVTITGKVAVRKKAPAKKAPAKKTETTTKK